ncbi:MAG: hypothetical protein JSW73_04705, partial [Candidatus Woesearchaeota archaeon]
LTIAKLLNCEFPDTIQVMRKTVIDGSNTSGFQRTVLVGLDGWLEMPFGKVGINFLSLEEDAGRRVAEDKNSVTYRLDRLGIPMLEIVTAPDMKTPEQVAEVARKIGLLVRATGKAMRGIGTVRQDVNVSIRGHCRVEMKGVQDLKLMHKYIDVEIKRQQTSKDEVPHVRNVKPDFTSKYLRPLPGAARMYPETDIPLIHITKEKLAKLKLPETHEEKLSKFKKLGLSDNLAKQLVTHKKVALFEELASKYKVNPTIIADTVLSIESRVRKEIGKEVKFSKEKYHDIFDLLSKNKIVKESIFDVFVQLAKTGKIDLSKFKTLSDTDLKKEIDRLLKEHKNAPENKITGIIIGQLRGKAEPKKIIEILKRK